MTSVRRAEAVSPHPTGATSHGGTATGESPRRCFLRAGVTGHARSRSGPRDVRPVSGGMADHRTRPTVPGTGAPGRAGHPPCWSRLRVPGALVVHRDVPAVAGRFPATVRCAAAGRPHDPGMARATTTPPSLPPTPGRVADRAAGHPTGVGAPSRLHPGPGPVVASCVVVTVAVRLALLAAPLTSDEAGLWMVGGQWSPGPSLYAGRVRGEHLLVALLVTGAPAVLGLAFRLGRPPRGGAAVASGPVALAVLVWEAVSVAGGGSYWLHYLVGLVPACSCSSPRAWAVPARRRGGWASPHAACGGCWRPWSPPRCSGWRFWPRTRRPAPCRRRRSSATWPPAERPVTPRWPRSATPP